MVSRLFLFLAIFRCCAGTLAQVNCMQNAHSHNDYLQKNPLSDALKYRFASIEADVFLVNGELLVSHTHPFEKKPTLEELYLEPLQKICAERGGKIYDNAPLILLIDFKSNANKTYAALKPLLEKYKSMLTRAMGSTVSDKAVTIIITGNKPFDMEYEGIRYAFIDQGLLSKENYPGTLCPLLSTKYSTMLSWKGRGEIPPAEKEKLRIRVAIAHEQGKKVRLWASPENEKVWKVLLDCGVDLINTNELEKLSNFLHLQN